jgi:hypothetical protein
MQTVNIKISTLTGKLKGFEAINTNTLTNSFCSKMRKTDAICKNCYSAAMLEGLRKNCAPAWQRNSDIFSEKVLLSDQLPTINAHSFRFHAHGELINLVHLENYINISRKNPFTTFALWTKRKDLVNKFIRSGGVIPDNLILIFSNAKTDKVLNKIPAHFDKVFNASESGEVKEGQTECTGKSCMACMACYRKDNGHTIIVEKVK